MASIGDLVISLRADIAQFRSGMTEANRNVKDLQSRFDDATESVKNFAEGLAGLFAAHEIIGFMSEAAEATRNWVETLSTFQGIAGLSSQAAGTLAASAQIAGVQTDIVTTAMARLGTVIATNPEKFNQLGIAIRDSSGQLLPMVDVMRNSIVALDGFKAGTDRAAAAGFLFGRGAEAWITQLDKLGPELKAANWDQNARLVQDLGLSMSDAKATAEEWARAEGTLKLELLGVENQIGAALLPAIEALGQAIATYARNGDLKAWAEDAARAILSLTIALAELTDFFAEHNKVMGSILAISGGVSFLTTGSMTGFAALAAGWQMTGTGADEAAAKVHAATQKIISDLTDARNKIGSVTQPGAGAGGGAGADGTKTFNVPDPKLDAFNSEYNKLLSNYAQDLDYQKQLKTAYLEGSAAVRQLQVDHAGELAVYKLLDDAESKHIAVSDQMLEAARRAAEADQQAKGVADEQKAVRDAMVAAVKQQDDAMLKAAQSADALTTKEQDLAKAEAAVWQAYQQGNISLGDFESRVKSLVSQFNGPDKGMQEFASAAGQDFSSLIGKVTDFSTILGQAKNNGQSVFQQLAADAMDFFKSLEQILIKLLIINPLLNSLGLGDSNGKSQLPTLDIGGLFGKLFSPSTSTATPGYKTGGDFTVGGVGGADSQLVSFRATPGERVSIDAGADSGRGPTRSSHTYVYSPTFVTPNADSFRKSNSQHGADAMRQMQRAKRLN